MLCQIVQIYADSIVDGCTKDELNVFPCQYAFGGTANPLEPLITRRERINQNKNNSRKFLNGNNCNSCALKFMLVHAGKNNPEL